MQGARVFDPFKPPAKPFMKRFLHPKATAEGVQRARVFDPLKPSGTNIKDKRL